MISIPRTGRHVAIALASVLLTHPSAAQEPPLGEIEIPVAPLLIELDNAEVRVVVGRAGTPTLRWWKASASEPGEVELEPAIDGDRIVASRPPLSEGLRAARLVLEVLVETTAPGLTINGSGLHLSVAGAPSGDEETAEQPIPTSVKTSGQVELNLATSQIDLSGVAGVKAVLVGCWTTIANSSGKIEIEAIGGDLRFTNHNGPLRATLTDLTTAAEGVNGPVEVTSTDGSFLLRSAVSSHRIVSNSTQVQVIDSSGNGDFVSTDSMVDILDSRLSRLNLKGTSSHIRCSRITTSTTIDLTAGSLTIDDGAGQLSGAVRGSAEFVVNGFDGDLTVNLTDASRADLRTIRGNVTTQVSSAELDVDGAQSLTLTADDARVSVARILELKKTTATRSEIDLDLSICTAPSIPIQAGDESFFRVQLATPCRVQAKGVDATASNRVSVTGCEYQIGQSRRWATKNVRGVNGNSPVMLIATLAESAELTVEGR